MGDKALDTVYKLDRANPDKYCWPDLVGMAMSHGEERLGRKESARSTVEYCKRESVKEGSCHCGKWQNGEVWDAEVQM